MSKPDWIPFENNYVLVTEFDTTDEFQAKYSSKTPKRGPLIAETYLDEARTLRRAFEAATSPYRARVGYGRVTVARLVFEDIPLDLLLSELAQIDEPK